MSTVIEKSIKEIFVQNQYLPGYSPQEKKWVWMKRIMSESSEDNGSQWSFSILIELPEDFEDVESKTLKFIGKFGVHPNGMDVVIYKPLLEADLNEVETLFHSLHLKLMDHLALLL